MAPAITRRRLLITGGLAAAAIAGVELEQTVLSGSSGVPKPGLGSTGFVWRNGRRWDAQRDPTNGHPGGGLRLPALAISASAPFTVYNCLNNGYSRQVQPDGSCWLECRQGDRPGTGGGDRSGLGVNGAGHPDPSTGLPGGGVLIGIAGRRLFYRYEFMLVDKPGYNLDYHYVNNLGDWHGIHGGPSTVKVAPDPAGQFVGVKYAPFIKGVAGPGRWVAKFPLVHGQWYNLLVDILWTVDATGHITVSRDGVASGSITGQTMKTFPDGSTENVAIGYEAYMQKVAAAPIPPMLLGLRNLAIAPTAALAMS